MDEDRARGHGGHSELGGPTSGEGADLISALPNDVIILVLVHLRCARSAVRTGILSRRWHGLWTRLPDLVFRDVAPRSLLAALSSFGPGDVSLSLLDIHVPAEVQDKVPANHVSPSHAGTSLRSSSRRRQPTKYISSLLHAAARLSPAVLRFNHPHPIQKPFLDVDLSSCFRRATSIELHTPFLCFLNPQSELPALQSLSLSGCRISLAALVPLCPNLRVLRVAEAFLQPDVTIRSASLQVLAIQNKVTNSSAGRVHVEALALKRFTMVVRTRGVVDMYTAMPTGMVKVRDSLRARRRSGGIGHKHT